MKARYKLQNVDRVEASLAVTMTIEDWKSMLKQIDQKSYPLWVFANKIRCMIELANQTFEESHDATD